MGTEHKMKTDHSPARVDVCSSWNSSGPVAWGLLLMFALVLQSARAFPEEIVVPESISSEVLDHGVVGLNIHILSKLQKRVHGRDKTMRLEACKSWFAKVS